MNTLQAGEAVRFGWETFKKRPWFFIGTFVVVTVLSNISFQAEDIGWDAVTPAAIFALILIGIGLAVVNTVAKMGGNAFLLKAHDAPEGVAFKDIWAPHPFWRFIGAMLLRGIVIAGPLLVLVLAAFLSGLEYLIFFMFLGIPAVLWLVYTSIRLSFIELVVMEKGLMPVDALKASYRMTQGVFWKLVWFMTVLLGVNLLGLLALVVGMLVSIPVSMFAFAHMYRSLQMKGESA